MNLEKVWEGKPVYGNEIRKMLEERKTYLEKWIQEKAAKVNDAPSGELRINKSRKRTQYYHRRTKEDRDGKYIPEKQMDLIRQLAQKAYDKKVMTAAVKELRTLQSVLRSYTKRTIDDIYSELPEARRNLIVPIEETDEMLMQRWSSREYKGKEIAADVPELITDRGEKVRSKSELIIANLLNQANVPYRYECPLVLRGIGTVYPDFTILNVRTRKEIIWEHQGMMSDPVYAEYAVQKEQSYILNGYYPGENLIKTSETKERPLNVRIVKIMIDRYCK